MSMWLSVSDMQFTHANMAAGISQRRAAPSHDTPNIKSGWKGPLCSSNDLDWIPRYILLDASGSIKVYRAITTKDNQLLNQIQ